MTILDEGQAVRLTRIIHRRHRKNVARRANASAVHQHALTAYGKKLMQVRGQHQGAQNVEQVTSNEWLLASSARTTWRNKTAPGVSFDGWYIKQNGEHHTHAERRKYLSIQKLPRKCQRWRKPVSFTLPHICLFDQTYNERDTKKPHKGTRLYF